MKIVNRKSPTVKGFTLLEMIVAIAILAFGLIGVLEAVSAGLRASRFAEDYSTAAMLAQQKITELVVQTEVLEPGEEAGDFGELFPRFTWQYFLQATSVEGLLQATIVVSWQVGPRERSFTVETCLAQGLSADEEEETDGMDLR